MRTEILEAAVDFFDRPFRKPLQLSSGLITEITEARALELAHAYLHDTAVKLYAGRVQ